MKRIIGANHSDFFAKSVHGRRHSLRSSPEPTPRKFAFSFSFFFPQMDAQINQIKPDQEKVVPGVSQILLGQQKRQPGSLSQAWRSNQPKKKKKKKERACKFKQQINPSARKTRRLPQNPSSRRFRGTSQERSPDGPPQYRWC